MTVATVLAHPLACVADAFRRPAGRDIQEKQTLAKSAKAAFRAMFTKKAWFSPYVDLVRSLKSDPTRDVTKSHALGVFVKNHKLFTAVGSALLLDALVVAGTYGKHCLDLRKWEKDEPARLAEAARIKKEKEDNVVAKAEAVRLAENEAKGKEEASRRAVEAARKAEKFNTSCVFKNYFKALKNAAAASRREKQLKAEREARTEVVPQRKFSE